MSYAQLKAFHALAIEGTINKASARIHLTQPAVSTQIKRLEGDHGKSLFRRQGNNFQLTKDGELLFAATLRMFRAENDAKLALSTSKGKFGGSLTIGSDGPHTLLSVIEKYKLQNPNTYIDVALDNAQATWLNLLGLKIDVGIMAGAPSHPGVVRKNVSKQNLVALIPKKHELNNGHGVHLKDLHRHSLIFRESGSGTQARVNSAFLSKGLSVAPILTLGSREAVVEAVARGMGIGFVFEHEVRQGAMYRTIPIVDVDIKNTDEIICLKEQRSNPLVSALFDSIE